MLNDTCSIKFWTFKQWKFIDNKINIFVWVVGTNLKQTNLEITFLYLLNKHKLWFLSSIQQWTV